MEGSCGHMDSQKLPENVEGEGQKEGGCKISQEDPPWKTVSDPPENPYPLN